MNKSTMETLTRRLERVKPKKQRFQWLVGSAKSFLLFIFLVGLFSCEQIKESYETSINSAGEGCWSKWGLCAKTKWKFTGVTHPSQAAQKQPELAEIIVFSEYENTCTPDREWFTANDPQMEAIGRKKPQQQTDQEKEQQEVYRKRKELDCSRVQFTLKAYIIKDKTKLQLYKENLPQYKYVTVTVDPPDMEADVEPDSNKAQAKFLIPKSYLSQISIIINWGSGKRIWKNGKTLATKPEKEQRREMEGKRSPDRRQSK